MRVARETLTVHTEENQQFLDITKLVRDALARIAVQNGVLVANPLHTTVALIINESQSALLHDLGALLQKCVPRRDGYRHDDRRYSDCDRANGHAHLRSMLLGHSVALPIADGEMVLGQYQSIILAELDGPRDRVVSLQVVGE